MGFLPDQSGELIGIVQKLNGTGFIQMYGGTSAPGGWLFCDGSVLSQTTYATLFAKLGTSFNTGGEGVGNFRLPDFRGRSPMGVGTGTGLTVRTLGQYLGEENHTMTSGELVTHTHVQNAHAHIMDTHNHTVTDAGHTHTQAAHTHTVTDAGHTHTQVAHSHSNSQTGHSHVDGWAGVNMNASYSTVSVGVAGNINQQSGTSNSYHAYTSSEIANITVLNATPTNNTATTGITNNNTTATNNSATTGITNASTIATMQDATATNQNTGSSTPFNVIHPSLVCNFIIMYI